MRRRPRLDNNHQQVVAQLRAMPGVTVCSLASIGDGCPDLVVGYQGQNYLIELKNPEWNPAKRKLTPDEENWHSEWMGQVDTCETVAEVAVVIGWPHEQLVS